MEARLLKRGETSGRSDDNAETIRKRFRTFVEQSLPVIDHYEAKGKAHRIQATQTPDEVFVHVQKVVEAVHARLNGSAAAAAAAAPAKANGAAAAPAKKAEAAAVEAVANGANGTPALAFA